MRIKTLDNIHEKDIKYFGRKAFYLGALTREGFRVPAGIGLFLNSGLLDESNINLVNDKLSILGLDKKKLAVRSSALDEDDFLLSQAGKYETYLHVTDPIAAIQRCLEHNRSCIIQEMIDSSYGGVCFSECISGAQNIIIEMCLGANTGATQGKGKIARVHIAKDSLEIKSTYDPDLIITNSMTHKLIELAGLAKNLELRLGFGVDIEWCVHQDIIYFLQARPITALNTANIIEKIKNSTLLSLLNEHSAREGLWSDISVGDMFRNTSVLFMDVLNHDLGKDWAVRRVFEDLGLRPAKMLNGPLFRIVCARAYICITNYLNFLAPDLFLKPSIKQSLNGILQISFELTRLNLKNIKASFLHMCRLIFIAPWRFLRARKKFKEFYSNNKIQELKNRACSYNYQKNNTENLYQEFSHIRSILGKEVIYAHLMSDIIAGICQSICKFYLKLLFGKESETWEFKLSTGLLGNLNTEMSLELYDFAHDKINLDEFMRKYGHRGSPDWDFAAPRFREVPQKIYAMAASVKLRSENLHARFEQQIAIRQLAQNNLDKYLNNSFLRRIFKKIIQKEINYLQYFSPIREETQSVVYHWIELLRKILLDIGMHVGIKDEIFYLKEQELKILCDDAQREKFKNQFIQLARERKYEQELSRRIYVPHIFEQKDLNSNLFNDDVSITDKENFSFINGIKASQGKVRGRAKVMQDLDEVTDIGPEDIIIAQFADPSFTPILLKAAGLVLEQGSVYSHCALVAREFGLPVVVNAQGATSRIKSGQLITLDADAGRVWLGAL
jgi:phosphohistidine swiveling domain-containing protein